MNLILKYLKPHYKTMFGGFIVKLLGTLAELGVPYVLAYIIDSVIPLRNIKLVCFWGCGMFVLAVCAKQFNIIANRISSGVSRDTTREIRSDLYRKTLEISYRQTDTVTTASLVSRLTSDTYNVHQMLGMMQRLGIRVPIIIIGGVIISFTLDPVIALLLLATLPVIGLIIYVVSKNGIPLFTISQRNIDNMTRVVRENITGIRVIKSLTKGKDEEKRFDKANIAAVNSENKANIIMGLLSPLCNLTLNIGLALVILVGAIRINNGNIQIGKIIAFQSYFTIILNAMIAINRIFTVYSKSLASAARISEVLELKGEIVVENIEKMVACKSNKECADIAKETVSEVATDLDINTPHIQFENVCFSYYDNPNIDVKYSTLKNISFSLNHGDSLGIIGSTGAGKTTIINLLMRLYDVTSGEIKIDGVNIKNIDFNNLKNKFGVVFQNDTLFQGTIRDNIDFWRNIDSEQIETAIESAQAKEFIMQKENYLDSEVAFRGANFSGGQKQRILLSRALAGNSEIIILDDSSSALDYKTDAMLRKALNKTHKDSTMIMIAQRINTVRNLDHILVLDNGYMVGYGTHDELLENCEVYKEIYNSQIGGDENAC